MAKATGRPRQTTHEEIKRVALELFATHGYASTSLAEIATAVGVGRTTLFSYVPAKRDLLWEDHEVALARVRAVLADEAERPAVEMIVAGILAASRYDTAEHEMFAVRWRIVHDDDELRAYASLRSGELLQIIVSAVRDRFTWAPAELVDSVTRALMAVASHATQDWSTQAHVDLALDDFTAQRLAPLAGALGALLP